MANPQIENGHLDIANEIVEALAKIRISGEEMQCLWVIFRKTYGWKKKEDRIALSQFSEMTGLKKQSVHRALKKLSTKKLIVVNKIDYSQNLVYAFNKNHVMWKPYTKKLTVSIIATTVYKKVDSPSTKKLNTKETIQKKLTKEIKKRAMPISQSQYNSFLQDSDFIETQSRDLKRSANEIKRKIERIRDGCLSKGNKYYDLPATLRNWFKNDDKFGADPPPPGIVNSTPKPREPMPERIERTEEDVKTAKEGFLAIKKKVFGVSQ